jgi:hypothetical protein
LFLPPTFERKSGLWYITMAVSMHLCPSPILNSSINLNHITDFHQCHGSRNYPPLQFLMPHHGRCVNLKTHWCQGGQDWSGWCSLNFVTSIMTRWVIISIWRRVLLHGVSYTCFLKTTLKLKGNMTHLIHITW